jgi:hypothetical protein
MFRTKHVSYNATITFKAPKTDNVPINVIAIVTTHIQESEHKVFKERELVKTKGLKNGNKKNIYEILSLKLLHSYKIMGLKNNLLLSMRVHYKVIGLDYLIIQP